MKSGKLAHDSSASEASRCGFCAGGETHQLRKWLNFLLLHTWPDIDLRASPQEFGKSKTSRQLRNPACTVAVMASPEKYR